MLVVIYDCPIFVKVGGWSFTLLPSRHTKFGLNRLKTEKISPQHILLLGAVSRPFSPAKVALPKSLPHCPLSPPPAKKKSGAWWHEADPELMTNRQFSSIPQCTCPISHNTPLRTKMCAFLFWMLYVVGYGTRAVWDLWDCSIVTEQNQM